jgi:hypothetical protein
MWHRKVRGKDILWFIKTFCTREKQLLCIESSGIQQGFCSAAQIEVIPIA